MTEIEPPAPVSKLPLLIMGAVIAMAVLTTIVLVGVRGQKTYDDGTPQAALQDFVNAAIDGDQDEMVSLLTERARTACEAGPGEAPLGRVRPEPDFRAELTSIEIAEDSADARVTFRRSNTDDPFDSSSWSFDRSFTLTLEDGSWQVERAGWPSPFENCTAEL